MGRMILVEYVGPKYPGGVVEDYEHTKYYFGPENSWKCEIPDILFGMILQDKGPEMFMPSAASGAAEGAITQEQLEKAKKDLEQANLALQKREDAVKLGEDASGERDRALDRRTAEIEKREKAVEKREKRSRKK